MLVNDGELNFPRVSKLFVDSETLDSPTRKLIEDTFQARAIDFYATTEVGVAAFQIGDSSGLYCVADDNVIFETKINSNLQGGDEDIVLTGLVNMTTPIIRYKIGDVCEPGSRAPIGGNGFSTVKSIHGKYLDFLVKPDGSVLSSHAAKQNLTHLKGIRRFRVIQESLTLLNIEIEPNSDWSINIENEIRELFRRDIGPSVTVVISLVEGLAQKQVNYKKFKVVESKIAQEFLSKG
jgi:phenylacetate-CoA ligase